MEGGFSLEVFSHGGGARFPGIVSKRSETRYKKTAFSTKVRRNIKTYN